MPDDDADHAPWGAAVRGRAGGRVATGPDPEPGAWGRRGPRRFEWRPAPDLL